MLNFGKNRPYLAIELHSTMARLGLVKKTANNYQLIKFQEIIDLSWPSNPELLATALTTFLDKHKCRSCFISLANHYFEFHPQPELTNLDTAEQLETVHLELERLYGAPANYYVDFNNEGWVTLATHYLDPLLAILHTLRLPVSVVTANCFVLANLNQQPLNWQHDNLTLTNQSAQTDSIVLQLVQDGLTYAIN